MRSHEDEAQLCGRRRASAERGAQRNVGKGGKRGEGKSTKVMGAGEVTGKTEGKTRVIRYKIRSRQGRKVPGRVVGGTCLCYAYRQLPAAPNVTFFSFFLGFDPS